jgi:tetratricopeptide (TPR) repeat protein
VRHLATRLAAGRGVINSIETAREMANPTIGSGCVLQAYLAFERPHSEMLETARTCLEETLALRPNDPDANAALAVVLLKIDPPDAPTKLSQRALKLADNAVDLAPYSDRGAAARMAALFRAGQIEAAVMAGRRGMELNPNNAAIPAKLGSILFTVGKWEEGIRLVIKAGEIETGPLRDAEITLAMDAYRRGEYDEALLRLEQMGKTDCFCANVLRAATLGQLGRKQEAEAAAHTLRVSRGRFEKSFRKDMEARRFAPVIIASLEAGLAKAGISVK